MADLLAKLVRLGIPSDALAFYGRWWQLETYLRELIYVELRARYGRGWEDQLGQRAPSRAERDAINAYMASADAGDVLAYLDSGHLFTLIAREWNLFEPVLLPRPRWEGAVDELRPLRNRNAHYRRPHTDDVPRLELFLRDLEAGARRFYGSYAAIHPADTLKHDPVVKDWIGGRHPTASRLLEHANAQYHVLFRLSYSKRPWAGDHADRNISGTPGYLWHAHWTIGIGGLETTHFWDGLSGYHVTGDALLHVIADDPCSLTVTFPAVDDPTVVADGIGNCFDTLLTRTSHHRDFFGDEEFEGWRSRTAGLPSRVQTGSILETYDPQIPVSIFSA